MKSIKIKESINNMNNPLVSIPKIINNLPISDGIIGRIEDINHIRKQLLEANSTVLVNGMAGIGKTSVVLKYIEVFFEEYKHILFVSVTNSLVEAFVYNPHLVSCLSLKKEVEDYVMQSHFESAFLLILRKLNEIEGLL